MDSRVTREFDPNFPIPEGLADAVYANVSVDDDVDFEIDEDPDLGEESTDGVLETPNSWAVVSEEVRTGPDGSQIVDIVIEIEDVEGADTYEVRLTKS